MCIFPPVIRLNLTKINQVMLFVLPSATSLPPSLSWMRLMLLWTTPTLARSVKEPSLINLLCDFDTVAFFNEFSSCKENMTKYSVLRTL